MQKFIRDVLRFNVITQEPISTESNKKPVLSSHTTQVKPHHKSGSNNPNGGHLHVCNFCDNKTGQSNHSTVQCNKLLSVKNVQHLKNLLTSSNLCWKCLRRKEFQDGRIHHCSTEYTIRGKLIRRPTCSKHQVLARVCPEFARGLLAVCFGFAQGLLRVCSGFAGGKGGNQWK